MCSAVSRQTEPLVARDEAFASMAFPSSPGTDSESFVESRRRMLSQLSVGALSLFVGAASGAGIRVLQLSKNDSGECLKRCASSEAVYHCAGNEKIGAFLASCQPHEKGFILYQKFLNLPSSTFSHLYNTSGQYLYSLRDRGATYPVESIAITRGYTHFSLTAEANLFLLESLHHPNTKSFAPEDPELQKLIDQKKAPVQSKEKTICRPYI